MNIFKNGGSKLVIGSSERENKLSDTPDTLHICREKGAAAMLVVKRSTVITLKVNQRKIITLAMK